jgi:hypothetical protein
MGHLVEREGVSCILYVMSLLRLEWGVRLTGVLTCPINPSAFLDDHYVLFSLFFYLYLPLSLLQAGLVLPAIQQCQVASLKQKKKQELLKEP